MREMWRSRLAWSALLLAGAVVPALSACAGGPDTDPVLTASSGDISGVLVIKPFPPPVMQDTELTLALRDRDGEAIEGARVHYDLTMPAMEMPDNRADATEVAPGSYEADVLFTMAGEWQVDAEVIFEGGQETLTFLFDTR